MQFSHNFMFIKFVYHPIKKEYKSNHGLSEKLIKKKLENDGWDVYRGGFLHCLRMDDLYPNVKKKYSKLKEILPDEKLEYLSFISRVHHGIPDYFCHRKVEQNVEYKFIECKLGHEQLSSLQKKCIKILLFKGYVVEVHKTVFDCTKLRSAYVNLYTNEKRIIEQQMRLKLKN